MIDFFLLLVSIGTLAVLVSKSHIFSGIREKFEYAPFYREKGLVTGLRLRIGALLNCTFCLSFWFSLASFFLFPIRMATVGGNVTKGVLDVFAMWGLSSIFAGVLTRLFSGKS